MKIAIVTCAPQNDYPRARSLRAAAGASADATVLIVRNRHTNLLRYPEVMLRLIKTRLIDRPDAYLITFRGYELLLLMKLTLVRKPIIFDELVNFTEWMEEQGRLRRGTLPYRLFRRWYAWLTGRCRIILADTDAHASYSAMLNKLSIERYRVIPASIEESVFRNGNLDVSSSKPFTVLYYGHMVALHGLDYVLEAAKILKDQPDIIFRIIGGKRQGKVSRACEAAAQAGARVTHESWLPFEELPEAIYRAGLTLGGPFGDTLQADFVITAKTYQVLACGAPVLIGKNRVNEGFTDKENCLMVSQADSEALADAITWAYGHPEELQEIGKAGKRLYERHFSQEHVNLAMQEIITELRHGAG